MFVSYISAWPVARARPAVRCIYYTASNLIGEAPDYNSLNSLFPLTKNETPHESLSPAVLCLLSKMVSGKRRTGNMQKINWLELFCFERSNKLCY